MRFAILALGLLTQSLWATPATTIEKSADGLTVYCKENADVGIWATSMTKATVNEAGGVLSFDLDTSFIKCAAVAGGFDWVSRNPYEPISRVDAGKVEITLVDNVAGVLFDGDTFARITAPAATAPSQTFHFTVNESQILAEVARLRPGQSYTKKFYFAVEHRATPANGASHYVTSGSYDFTLTWTK